MCRRNRSGSCHLTVTLSCYTSCYIYVSLLLHNLETETCSICLTQNAKFPVYVLANTCCHRNVTIMSQSNRYVLLTGQIPTIVPSRHPNYPCSAHLTDCSFFHLPDPRPRLGFHRNSLKRQSDVNRVNSLWLKTRSYVSIGRVALDFFPVSTFCT